MNAMRMTREESHTRISVSHISLYWIHFYSQSTLAHILLYVCKNSKVSTKTQVQCIKMALESCSDGIGQLMKYEWKKNYVMHALPFIYNLNH